MNNKTFSIDTGCGTIRGVISFEDGDAHAPLVLITPAFTKTARDYLLLAMYLTRAGFRVARYDCRNHIGISDGDVLQFTLSSAIADLLAVLRYFAHETLVVVSSSLSSRVAVRALGDFDCAALITLIGVVNLRDTQYQACGEDLFDLWQSGVKSNPAEEYEVMDYRVRFAFIDDAIRIGIVHMEGTIEDLSVIRAPVYAICSQDDPWVRFSDIDFTFRPRAAHRYERGVYVIPGANHQLGKNPRAARTALCKVVDLVRQTFNNHKTRSYREPLITEIVAQNKLERVRERAAMSSQEVAA